MGTEGKIPVPIIGALDSKTGAIRLDSEEAKTWITLKSQRPVFKDGVVVKWVSIGTPEEQEAARQRMMAVHSQLRA